MEKLVQKVTFGKRMLLRDFRRAFDIKQEQLAKAFNKKQSTISRMESEDKELNLEEIKKLVEILKLKPEDLLKHDGNIVFIGNIFSENEEVNYKNEESEEELESLKLMHSELNEEVKELKTQNRKQLEQIQRLFEMLEVKHHTMA